MDDMEPRVSVWLDGDKVNYSQCSHENLPNVKTCHLTTLHVLVSCLFFVGIQFTKLSPLNSLDNYKPRRAPKGKDCLSQTSFI